MTIVIKHHLGSGRDSDFIPGLHIHNQRERDGVHLRRDENDRQHLDDPATLEQHHFPKGRLYTPEIDQLREKLERRPQASELGQEGSEAQQVPPVSERKEQEDAGDGTEKKVNCDDVNLEKNRCCKWESMEFPVDLDLEHQRIVFFKIMFLRAFQFIAAFGLTFYVQLSWEMTQVVKKPPFVQFTFDFPWILFIALSLYGILWSVVRFTYAGRSRCFALHLFILKTVSLVICAYIPGVRWQLIVVSTVSLTLAINSILLAFIPLFNEDVDVAKRRGLLQILSFLDILLLSIGVWFMLSGMLSNASSYIYMAIAHENVYTQLFLYCFPTFVIAETLTALDLVELRRILKGQRFPVDRKSWLRAVISLL